ncbi:MAG: ATP synthase epsilon chain [Desulfotomaculum sp. 46_296]|nr:MAG: ATP synthase epsilon chain [Desulfotomaculum sp. 46_296]KUK84535.1 MAG: ATP synthase epsilon chain [Desulfofundulus kuznetsovii]HAU32518.1 F0F1 ATP synthase subunit epsilon [Desulfotomaculum sp.]
MAGKTQRLEVVTPERKVYSEDVEFVVVPGSEGEMGFLPGHTPLASSLKIGAIRVTKEAGAKPLRIAITGGFVEVMDSRVTILTNAAEREDEIDRKRAEAAKERAEQRLAAKMPDLDVMRAELALKRALNRLKLFE